MTLPAFIRRSVHAAASHLVLVALTAIVGIIIGWFAHGVTALAHDVSAEATTALPTIKGCRDEVISVDNAHNAVSCSAPDMASELKDGYLICHCKKK